MHQSTETFETTLLALTFALLIVPAGCASAKAPAPELESAAVAGASKDEAVERNHFRRDRTGNLSESDLRELLQTPIHLETGTRVGVVPVQGDYRADREVPLEKVPKRLGRAVEDTGYFDVATEVTTDWPKERSVSGLRELAARYRSRYLVLYRHRFVTRSRVNGWGWTYPTVVGLFATPAQTVEVAGVLEATFFDVQNGSILFTAYERIRTQRKMNIWHNEHKRREMKQSMLQKASDELSKDVTAKIRRLVRPSKGS